jgi:bifunctional non-homologous end joining protein LigD
MFSRMRPVLSGFISPCLPTPAERPPSGSGWFHEIKLDGFRLMARRDVASVRLLTRTGIDWSSRYPGHCFGRQPSAL